MGESTNSSRKGCKVWRKEIDREDKEELPPVGSLMFSEVERRINVVIFRACTAHSVYDARRMVIHGRVLLNRNFKESTLPSSSSSHPLTRC